MYDIRYTCTNTGQYTGCNFETIPINFQKSYDRYPNNKIKEYYVVTSDKIQGFITEGETLDKAIDNAYELISLFQSYGALDKEKHYAIYINILPEICYI